MLDRRLLALRHWRLPLLCIGGGLYVAYALDLLHDERRDAPDRLLEADTVQLVVYATALIAMLGWVAWNQHRARVLEHQRWLASWSWGRVSDAMQRMERRARCRATMCP